MPIPETCQKHQFPFLCTFQYFINLGFSTEKADKLSLYAFGHLKEIYT